MKKSVRVWLFPVLWVFLGGVFVIGPLDLFHTCNDVQNYLIRRALTPQCGWPWYVPFQMGFAGLVMMLGWVFFKRNLSGRFKRRDSRFENENRSLIPISFVMVLLGYFMGYYLMDSPWHINWYLLAWTLSVFFLALGYRRIYILAFTLIGLTGVLVESALLSPAVEYFRYNQQDLLGRAPAWLLFVYGWIGVFIQEVTRDLD